MTGFVYRAAWPILDEERPVSALVAEASGQVDAMAAAAGCRLLGEVTWKVDDARLLGECAAVPVTKDPRARWGELDRHEAHVAAMAMRGLTDREIADVLGLVSESGVARLRQRRNIPPGSSRRSLGAPTSVEGAA